jgi:hypothetical protein
VIEIKCGIGHEKHKQEKMSDCGRGVNRILSEPSTERLWT